MSELIRQFYEKCHLPKPLIEQKLAAFSRNDDIAKEFELWITDKSYKVEGAVTIKGYTAKKLSELSAFLNGEGSFILLIELRENPDKALKRIKAGFKYK